MWQVPGMVGHLPRWLDARDAADYLDLERVVFLRLVKGGKLPVPSCHLGNRLPRWYSADLDHAMAPKASASSAKEILAAMAEIIEQESGEPAH
jgi:predicted DNA-binding transcriptional regulator AlpA